MEATPVERGLTKAEKLMRTTNGIGSHTTSPQSVPTASPPCSRTSSTSPPRRLSITADSRCGCQQPIRTWEDWAFLLTLVWS